MGRITIYTDGACSGNPGPGGWAWVVPDGQWGNGAENPTTNQRMEVTAVLEAIKSLDGRLHIVSDSTYVVNCFKDNWWRGWLKRGWKNSQKKPVANRDLWEPLIELYQQRDVTFEWVKGHAGNQWNERADELAVQARDSGVSNTGQSSTPPVTTAQSPIASERAAEASSDVAATDTVRIAITGVRPPDMGGYNKNPTTEAIRQQLVEILGAKATLAALENTQVEIYTSLGLGAETVAAEAALELGLSFIAVLPFADPSSRWPKESTERFEKLKLAAASVITLNPKNPTDNTAVAKAFSARDRWMAQNASEAVVIHNPKNPFSQRTIKTYEKAFAENLWVIEVP